MDGKNYCRRCMKHLPVDRFYETTDPLVDSSGLASVCKNCMNDVYLIFYENLGNMEKALHKMCTTFNVKFSNEAASATKTQINTLIETGKNVNSIFGIYKSKLTATKKSMDKSVSEDMSYSDIGTIYTSEPVEIKEDPIPQDVINFWGKDFSRDDLEFLEREYTNFKKTHKADTYAEIVLLKEVCYTMLTIKKLRILGDDTQREQKTLQDLMTKLAISPNVANAGGGNGEGESFGQWIRDIEKYEPAQWLKTDPRGDMYRDVGNVEEYFQKYIVRPLKNFILGSKDFNIDESIDSNPFDDDDIELSDSVLRESKEE